MTKEVRIYNGAKTTASIRDAVNMMATCKRLRLRALSNAIYKNRLKMD